VKLSQFRALCDREWRQESRGDVTALHLTDDSYAELQREAIMDGEFPGCCELFIEKAGAADARHGTAAVSFQNPVTRSPVKITGGGTWDWMEVRRPVPYALLEPADADTVPA